MSVYLFPKNIDLLITMQTELSTFDYFGFEKRSKISRKMFSVKIAQTKPFTTLLLMGWYFIVSSAMIINLIWAA